MQDFYWAVFDITASHVQSVTNSWLRLKYSINHVIQAIISRPELQIIRIELQGIFF